MQRSLLLLLGLTACGAPGPVSSPEPPALAVTLPAASTCEPGPALVTPTAAAPPQSRCWARGRPAVAAVAVRDRKPSCSPLVIGEVARVEREVRREFTVTKPNRLVVDFGCKTASDEVAEVWFEDGSGHGGSLRLVRLVRNGGQVSVRQLAYQEYRDHEGIEVSEGQSGWSTLEPLVKRAHMALLARPHELVLFDPSVPFGGHSSFSSRDFHLLLAIVDKDQNIDDRSFTGYDTSDERGDIVPMRMATDALHRELATMKLTLSSVSDDDRAFFNRRLRDTLAGDPYWWIRERYVGMAPMLGTIDTVPMLVTQVTRAIAGDAAGERTRDAALAAIASLTGWDPRLGDDHQPRTTEQAVAAVATACKL